MKNISILLLIISNILLSKDIIINSKIVNNNGEPLQFYDIAIGGIAIGVPGLVSMLEMGHQDYGLLEWKSLFKPAIKLSENRFKISPRLYNAINKDKHLYFFPQSKKYF